MPCDESLIDCYDPETKKQSSQCKHAGSPRPKKARQSKSTPKLLMIPFLFWQHWRDLHALVPSVHTVNKEYNVEVLTDFRNRFRRKRPALFKSGQCYFYQDNAPVHNSVHVTDYLTKMGIKTVPHSPYSPDHAPCDFCLLPKLRGCRYETTEEMKESVTKDNDTLTQENFYGAFPKLLERYNKCMQPEEITLKGNRVSFVYYQEKCPYEKCLETHLMILVYLPYWEVLLYTLAWSDFLIQSWLQCCFVLFYFILFYLFILNVLFWLSVRTFWLDMKR